MSKDIFFSSDEHLRHVNIATVFKKRDGTPLRGFSSGKEMDDYIIEKHNSVVRPQDNWYCLGDISMMRPRFIKDQLTAMHGHKRLIRGNHDIFKTKEYLEFFDEIYGVRVLDNIIFSHYPVHPASSGRYLANCHGHIHEGPDLPSVPREAMDGKELKPLHYINLTVEHLNDYTPIHLEDLRLRIKKLNEAYEN